MRILLDECISPAVAVWLRNQGHDAVSIHDVQHGLADATVLQIAVAEQRILFTNDKGFGERAVRLRQHHYGIVLLRLDDRRTPQMIQIIGKLLRFHADQIPNALVVVTERAVRITRA
jgi:predicted nuclease of predicted toxin-antitoxin system